VNDRYVVILVDGLFQTHKALVHVDPDKEYNKATINGKEGKILDVHRNMIFTNRELAEEAAYQLNRI